MCKQTFSIHTALSYVMFVLLPCAMCPRSLGFVCVANGEVYVPQSFEEQGDL
jgi:hypothetical protein